MYIFGISLLGGEGGKLLVRPSGLISSFVSDGGKLFAGFYNEEIKRGRIKCEIVIWEID